MSLYLGEAIVVAWAALNFRRRSAAFLLRALSSVSSPEMRPSWVPMIRSLLLRISSGSEETMMSDFPWETKSGHDCVDFRPNNSALKLDIRGEGWCAFQGEFSSPYQDKLTDRLE
jgi:hypothetical protein